MKIFFILTFIISFLKINSQSLYFELNGGWSGNLPSRLVIKQNGYSDINFVAKYYSEPFISPVYWLWRFYYLTDSCSGWSFEAVHHKIYLKNNPPEVQHFGISHGLNLLIINRIFYIKHRLSLNIGIGTVLAHPENEVRGKALKEKGNGIFGMGYYFSGVASNFSVSYKFLESKRLHINVEARMNVSYSIVPIVDGKAYLPNFSPQFIAGLGYRIWKKTKI